MMDDSPYENTVSSDSLVTIPLIYYMVFQKTEKNHNQKLQR